MKKVTVNYVTLNKQVEGFLISNDEDVKEFEKVVERNCMSAMTKMLNSKETLDRMDHVVPGFRPIEKAIANLALVQARLGKYNVTNPIYQMQPSMIEYISGIRSFVKRGDEVFINPSGGYCTVKQGALEVLNVIDAEYKDAPKKPRIIKGAKVINLENDTWPEKYTSDYIRYKLKEDSYTCVKELRLFDKEDLVKIFKEFILAGGSIVYVYTTGRDVDQMYMYSEAAIEAGLKKFIFTFNCGTDPDIDKFVTWLKHRAEVKVEPLEKF